MADSLGKLWLKGQAEEDIYFAKRDRELVAALRKKRRGNAPADSTAVQEKDASGVASRTETESEQGSQKGFRWLNRGLR